MISTRLTSYISETIDSLWLILTYRCQFNCPSCYTQGGSRHKDMSLKDAISICNVVAQLGAKNVVLIGGEPLLHCDISSIVKECSALNLATILITNGYHLEKEEIVLSLKKAGLTRAMISLHRNTTIGPDFLINRITEFKKIQKGLCNLKNHAIPTEVSCLLDAKNIDVYFSCISLALQENIKTVVFLTYVPPLGANFATTTTLRPKESARIISLIYQTASNYSDIKCNFVFQYPLCLLDKSVFKAMSEEGVLFGSHELLYTGRGLAMDPDGYILPGSHWVGYPLFHLNEIRKSTKVSHKNFLEKWNSEDILKFRSGLWHFPSQQCITCRLWALNCVGGNPLVWQFWEDKELLPFNYKIYL